jgi:hypothetical protein
MARSEHGRAQQPITAAVANSHDPTLPDLIFGHDFSVVPGFGVRRRI